MGLMESDETISPILIQSLKSSSATRANRTKG